LSSWPSRGAIRTSGRVLAADWRRSIAGPPARVYVTHPATSAALRIWKAPQRGDALLRARCPARADRLSLSTGLLKSCPRRWDDQDTSRRMARLPRIDARRNPSKIALVSNPSINMVGRRRVTRRTQVLNLGRNGEQALRASMRRARDSISRVGREPRMPVGIAGRSD